MELTSKVKGDWSGGMKEREPGQAMGFAWGLTDRVPKGEVGHGLSAERRAKFVRMGLVKEPTEEGKANWREMHSQGKRRRVEGEERRGLTKNLGAD